MRKTISTETTTVTSPAWTFAPDSVTVNGYTSTARYSLAKDATLYVFAGMLTPGTDQADPRALCAPSLRRAKSTPPRCLPPVSPLPPKNLPQPWKTWDPPNLPHLLRT